jgi:hypothetical protein
VLIVINVLLVILGSVAGLVALFGETWDSGRRRLTRLGYWTGACMALALTLGVAKECLNHQRELEQEVALKHERDKALKAFQLLTVGQAHALGRVVRATTAESDAIEGLPFPEGMQQPTDCLRLLLEYAQKSDPAREQAVGVK